MCLRPGRSRCSCHFAIMVLTNRFCDKIRDHTSTLDSICSSINRKELRDEGQCLEIPRVWTVKKPSHRLSASFLLHTNCPTSGVTCHFPCRWRCSLKWISVKQALPRLSMIELKKVSIRGDQQQSWHWLANSSSLWLSIGFCWELTDEQGVHAGLFWSCFFVLENSVSMNSSQLTMSDGHKWHLNWCIPQTAAGSWGAFNATMRADSTLGPNDKTRLTFSTALSY